MLDLVSGDAEAQGRRAVRLAGGTGSGPAKLRWAHNGRMGMFSQKQEEPGEWAALPAEPFDRDEADVLPEVPVADPLGLGLADPTPTSSISIPVSPAPEA